MLEKVYVKAYASTLFINKSAKLSNCGKILKIIGTFIRLQKCIIFLEKFTEHGKNLII